MKKFENDVKKMCDMGRILINIFDLITYPQISNSPTEVYLSSNQF